MILEEKGYTQVSEYKNARTKIKMECPEGHSFEILPNNWKKGVRCGICYRKTLQKGVVNQKASNLQQSKPSTIYNENVKKITTFLAEIKKNDNFTIVSDADSNGIIKKTLTHKHTGEVMNIWVYKESVIEPIDDIPAHVSPIYLNFSDLDIDIECIKEWMIDTHRG